MLTTNLVFRPLGSTIFAPGLSQFLAEFKSQDELLGSFAVSVFLLGYVCGPLVLAPLSELYGRTIVYHVNNVLGLIFTVACALSPSIGAVIAFRFLAGVANSCPLTVGAGSIADMFPREQRGRWMAMWVIGPLIGPVVGPVGKASSLVVAPILLIGNSWWIHNPEPRMAVDFLARCHRRKSLLLLLSNHPYHLFCAVSFEPFRGLNG